MELRAERDCLEDRVDNGEETVGRPQAMDEVSAVAILETLEEMLRSGPWVANTRNPPHIHRHSPV